MKYLENKFYNLACDSKRASIVNSTVPTCSSISEFDEAMLEEFIENSKLLVNTLGYKVFEKVDTSVVDKELELMYIKAARGADAKGVLVSDGFLVVKDSRIAFDITASMPDTLVKFRSRLIEKGIVSTDYVFQNDYIFTSPSLAASVVMGRSANGRTEWKTIDGRCIKDIEEA